MPELREVFDMVTKQVEPDLDSWKEQERRQRRSTRNRKIGGFVVVLAIAIAGGVLALTQLNNGGSTPANQPSPTPNPSPSATALGPNTPGRVVVGLDGTVQAAVPNLPLGASYLTVSPDGATIAFVAYHDGSTQLGTIGMDGSGLRWFTAPVINPQMLSWSPDGSRIAFAARGPGAPERQEIWITNADASNGGRLTSDAAADSWPSWSPDGSTIVYSNSGRTPVDSSGFSPTQEIWSIPVDGGSPTQLTRNDVWDDMPSYSPDGRQIVFSREGAILTMRADGANAHLVAGQSQNEGANFNPRWSPDGSRIAFIVYEGERSSSDSPLLGIRVLDLSTGQVTVVPGKVESDANAVAWMPSSDALVVNRYRG
jgi:Tol biopolymer transport system component